MHKVLLVGRYPPPLGGTSVHIQRLAHRLLQDTYKVSVVDPYTAPSRKLQLGSRLAGSLNVIQSDQRSTILSALYDESKRATVHFHISAGRRFYRAAPLLLGVTNRARKRLLTVHSGSWADEFQALSWTERWLAKRILSSFDDIICVNREQHKVLSEMVTSRLHVIPAFLSPTVNSRERLPDSIQRLREGVDAIVVTSGYGTPIYDYETLLQGVEQAQQRLPLRLGVVLATYGTWEDRYWRRILEHCNSTKIPHAITYDLTPTQFHALLSESHIYVRATRTDGDSVAIREAGAAGARVVASDAVTRPDGTVVFSSGDSMALADALTRVAVDPLAGRLSTTHLDSYRELIAAYRL